MKRSRTNTPLQALSLLNEVTYLEAARKLAERMITSGGSTIDERVRYGFRLAVCRPPTERELRVLADAVQSDWDDFKKQPEQAAQLTAFGVSRSKGAFSAEELAAYTLAANVLLNLDEMIMRE